MPDGMGQATIRARLARRGDTTTPAAQRRYAAAIMAIGMTKTQFAAALGLSGVAAITNQTVGIVYPSREGMIYLHENHGINPTFIMIGDFAHLDDDVKDRVFAALQVLDSGGGIQ